jgi:UDP-glucose 4-epimerase
MKILIIGSKGFIGSHCVTYFAKSNEVWECDVVNDYNNENYFLVDGTNANYSELFQSNNFDICINCSGAASVPNSIKNPQRDFVLNVYNVFKQLDAIRKFNPSCKYINLSSAAVYGNPTELPIKETHPLNPISPYGKHKKMAEAVCKEFYEDFKIQTCSLRIFSAYGPGLKKQLFWDLDKKAETDLSIKLYGTGKESRDFIYIDDLINAIECIIDNGKFNAENINVANGEELFINKVVSTFYAFFDKPISFKFGGENRKGDPINWVAEISKLKTYGYSPKVSLKQGLTNYFKWLRKNT